MASGIKGQLKPAAGSPDYSSTPLFTASATTTFIVSACNQASAVDTVRIAVVPGSVGNTTGTISVDYLLEFDYSLGGNSAIERTGVTVEAQSRVFVGSAGGNVSFSAYGIES